MLVNGQEAGLGYEALLAQLAGLDSSFPQYLSVKPQYIIPPETHDIHIDAMTKFNNMKLNEALKGFQELEKNIPKNEPNNPWLSATYLNIGLIQQNLGKHKDAIVSFQRQLSQSIKDKDYRQAEGANKNLAYAHRTTGTLEKYQKEALGVLNNSLQNNDQLGELEARLALGAINRAQGKHKDALEQYAIAYDLQQGRVDYEATRVEQHEYGVSDKKIGTDNIQQCVAVILHDPVTKMAALAHIDRFTDASSLKEVVKKFPEGAKLDAYLVGGRDRSTESKEVSDNNISRVIGELQKYTAIDIKAADIGDKGAPSGIVFDPQTGELKHSVPGKVDKTTAARKAALGLLSTELLSPLNFAFDLTKSDEMHGPIFTDRDKESLIRKYLNTPKVTEATEAWNANLIYEPLAKVAEKIKLENPEIVKSVITEHLERKLNQKSKINLKHRDALFKGVEKAVDNPNKTLFEVDQESDKRFHELTKPSLWKRVNTAVLEVFSKPTKIILGAFSKPINLKTQNIQNNGNVGPGNISTAERVNQQVNNRSDQIKTNNEIVRVTAPNSTPKIQQNRTSNKSLGR
jgi:tetratricopeptide (TPR) repeat protein